MKKVNLFYRLFITLNICLFVALPGWAQAPEDELITPSYEDADLSKVIEAVSAITGKNFVLDPRINNQKVTLISGSPMSADAFYETFLSVLQVYGYVALESGNLVKILPDTNARQSPGAESFGSAIASDDIVTRVVPIENVSAAQLVPILRPLIPQYGHLAAHPASNMLIISDRQANVRRLLSIIARIDQSSEEEIEVVSLNYASAGDMVRILQSLSQGARAADAATPVSLIADDRTNSILIGGEKSDRLRLRALIAHLDTPLEDGGNTQVIYLNYADAEDLSAKLKEQVTQTQQSTAGASTQKVTIWADQPTNALVVTAPPKVMRSMRSVIDQLDIRRAQVAIEAIIVDINLGDNLGLGVDWIIDGTSDNTTAGIINLRDASFLVGAATSIDSDTFNPAAAVPSGITFGVGRLKDNGTNFAALINTFANSSSTNSLSTPTLVTVDNEEAEISVGQQVPFITGSFSNTGGNNATNPFQTIQRQDVGTILKITPQINEGNAVILDLELEVSNVSGSTSATDLITNKRTIRQKVIVEDRGIIVLGGLVDEQLIEGNSRVPFLGSIPLLGNLFSSRTTERSKNNLMVFIKPTILRDSIQTRRLTNEKYSYIRDQQQIQGKGVQLMPFEERPSLPELPPETLELIPELKDSVIPLNTD